MSASGAYLPPPLSRRDGRLHLGDADLTACAALAGTPAWVYDLDAIVAAYRAFARAFEPLPLAVSYAVKANSNSHVLGALARAGCGFDANSRGELHRVRTAGGEASRTTMTGVGKTADDLRDGLEADIHRFNVESVEECLRLDAIACAMDREAHVLVRVNPDIDAATHPAIATGLAEHKFGLTPDDLRDTLPRLAALERVRVRGWSMHLGSQITDPDIYAAALRRLLAFAAEAAPLFGHTGVEINIGGGLGVPYHATQSALDPHELATTLRPVLDASPLPVTRLHAEPGRVFVAHAGVLLARVEYVKRTAARTFVILDAGMNDLVRPALYDAWHEIVPLVDDGTGGWEIVDVVGPVCETGDTFTVQRRLPRMVDGDLVALLTAGAYGATMSSTYNSRPLAPEICIRNGEPFVSRRRQSLDELLTGELPVA